MDKRTCEERLEEALVALKEGRELVERIAVALEKLAAGKQEQ